MKKDKLNCPIYHLPKDYTCPICKAWNSIDKPARKYFEENGAVSMECGECGAIKTWYKIPDPREPRERRMKQIYWEEEDE